MTEVQDLARFVDRASFDQLSGTALEQLKIRVLDALGVAIGALEAPPVQAVRGLLAELGGTESSTLIGGGKSSPDRAALYNGALVRYLDFMDSYLASDETNHPADNLGAVLAASEYAGSSGREFLTALAVAYQVHARLADVAPVRAQGFDHTTQGAYAVGAATAKALRLPADRIANAIAIAGTANNALRVTRTGSLSNWKGLAYPNTAKEGTFAALLAAHGITGPAEVFEGNKGFKSTIAGEFRIDWQHEDLERVCRTVIKKYDAEVHAQSALEAALDIRRRSNFAPGSVGAVRLRTFDVAHSIIGGGAEGDKRVVRTKEEADHSLPYMLAVALLDGRITPQQYAPERIASRDVQELLAKVEVIPDADLSSKFPALMPADLEVASTDGAVFHSYRESYEGFHDDPAGWNTVRSKFDLLASPFADDALRGTIVRIVQDLEHEHLSALTGALAEVGPHTV